MAGNLNALKEKHESLEKNITREQKRPGSDDLEIKDMKKRKLVIKEDILLLEHRGAPA
jgi:hypothetical protein